MSFTLVVGAAPIPNADGFYEALLAEAAHVVAADAAGEWCVEHRRIPDVAAGDFDSAEAGAARRLSDLGVEIMGFDRDKDETDLELAVAAAVVRWDAPVVVTAAFSRRIDHTLAAFGAVAQAGTGARAVDPGWSAWVCGAGKEVTVRVTEGTTVSVIALQEATGVTVTGTQWPLEDARLPALSGLGVSNRATLADVTASASTGALVIIALDGGDGAIY